MTLYVANVGEELTIDTQIFTSILFSVLHMTMFDDLKIHNSYEKWLEKTQAKQQDKTQEKQQEKQQDKTQEKQQDKTAKSTKKKPEPEAVQVNYMDCSSELTVEEYI